jgi:SAM-dependent MidA family methyltransferase
VLEGVRRLTDPGEMGERFKVVALAPHDAPTPAGF